MIIKPREPSPPTNDRKRRAGDEAETQMAFYLHRAFANSPDLFVLNNLRICDPEQPEHDGRPGVCQIDHLVIHRFGAFIIESKSVGDTVRVQQDGTGGDVWVRIYKGSEEGMPSPIRQAEMQGKFLRAFLQRHRTSLLGKIHFAARPLVKLLHGTDQRGFASMPIQIVVAISDGGIFKRSGGWKEPSHPFQTFLTKADLVTEKITGEYEIHKKSSSLFNASTSDYGMWWMLKEELPVVAEFLLASHTPVTRPAPGTPPEPKQPAHPKPQAHPVATKPVAAPPAPPPEPKQTAHPKPQAHPEATKPVAAPPASPQSVNAAACRACGGKVLQARWGKYGYHWHCQSCKANTNMPVTCSCCGTDGYRGKSVRIRKEGARYFRDCAACGIQENIWIDPPENFSS